MKDLASSVVVAVAICSLGMTAIAADNSVARAIYDSAATIPTNIKGVNTFAAPPAGFDAIGASDEALATFGLPPRPDRQLDPDAYAKWARAMSSPVRHRPVSEGRSMGAYSTGVHLASAPASAATSAGSAVPTSAISYNWSGVVSTTPVTSWKGTGNSFYYVVSEFTVPPVQQPFGSCDGGWDWQVNWNGLDGWKNGDVLQGGSSSEVYCSGGSVTNYYCGWVEWYPSYPILCEFTVNPGDAMFVETWSPNGGTNPGYVYIYDYNLQVGGTYQLTYKSGPALVANSAEYIVERPCCRSFSNGTFGYPLANYVFSFWYDNYAYTWYEYLNGKPATVPGSQSPTTYMVNMVDDGNTQTISYPLAGNGAGNEGKYGVAFYASGCAYSGGCAP